MDRVHWIYLAVIASALLLLFGATGLVMFTDIDLMDLARTFGPAARSARRHRHENARSSGGEKRATARVRREPNLPKPRAGSIANAIAGQQ